MTNEITNETPGGLFVQPWWLDAVAPGSWDEVRIEREGKLVARLPYVLNKSKAGMVLTMPTLTQYLGPWVDLGNGSRSKKIGRNKELTSALIDGLPSFENFKQRFHYSIENWTPWYWKGFSQTTSYTYVLDDLSDEDALFKGFDVRTRNGIRKGERLVDVIETDDFERFLSLNELVFSRQGEKLPYSRDFVRRLDEACRQREQRRIFIGQDSDGRDHAAVYLVWDEDSAYYLMGGGDPELRKSNATSICMWRAIQFARTVSRRFDFEGSMLEPVERFVRGFGGKPMPYSFVTSMTSKWKTRQSAKAIVRKLTGRKR